MANKPVLFAVDDNPDVLRAVERNLRRKYGRSRNRDVYGIFEPFLTTKGVGEYTGLGLGIVRGIIAGHGGEIRVEFRPRRDELQGTIAHRRTTKRSGRR